MKNSGIEWIGEIPDSWKMIPNKYLFIDHSSKVGSDWAKYKLLSLTTVGVKEKDVNSTGGKVPDSYENYQTVEPGDMVFCLFDLDCSAVFSGLSRYFGMITSAYDVLAPNSAFLDALFADYWFQYVFSDRYYKMYSKNIRYTVTTEMFGTTNTPVPPMQIQRKIGELLRNKCAEVDKLIEVQQAQIEKLKEYKQSVITEAVTKGLDPTAPMKDSGVEWIGKIPEGWEVCRIKNLPDYSVENCFIDGDWIESPDIADSGIRYLTTGNVGDGQFKYQGNGYITKETFDKLNCKFAYPGDWIIARLNAPYGRSCILPNDEERYVLAVDIVILRTKYNKKYLCYFTQCPEFQHTVEDFARGTAMKRISRTNLSAVKMVLPSIDEQNTIADYLDDKCAKIDKLIALKQSKIEKLQEYKKSLIYEYVTGKKEVI